MACLRHDGGLLLHHALQLWYRKCTAAAQGIETTTKKPQQLQPKQPRAMRRRPSRSTQRDSVRACNHIKRDMGSGPMATLRATSSPRTSLSSCTTVICADKIRTRCL